MQFGLKNSFLIAGVVVVILLSTAVALYAASATYTYDELNRLIRVDYPDGAQIDYAYDEVGNRTQVYGVILGVRLKY